MKRKVAMIPVLAVLVGFVFAVPIIPAQQSQQEMAVVVVDPDTDIELEILENEIAQLRRKLRLRRMRKIQDTKEWKQAYRDTAQRIKEWNEFANSYGIRE